MESVRRVVGVGSMHEPVNDASSVIIGITDSDFARW